VILLRGLKCRASDSVVASPSLLAVNETAAYAYGVDVVRAFHRIWSA
jgi:hypothetical protein